MIPLPPNIPLSTPNLAKLVPIVTNNKPFADSVFLAFFFKKKNQDTKGITCYTDCPAKPQEQGTMQELKDSVREGLIRDDSLRDFHWRRF